MCVRPAYASVPPGRHVRSPGVRARFPWWACAFARRTRAFPLVGMCVRPAYARVPPGGHGRSPGVRARSPRWACAFAPAYARVPPGRRVHSPGMRARSVGVAATSSRRPRAFPRAIAYVRAAYARATDVERHPIRRDARALPAGGAAMITRIRSRFRGEGARMRRMQVRVPRGYWPFAPGRPRSPPSAEPVEHGCDAIEELLARLDLACAHVSPRDGDEERRGPRRWSRRPWRSERCGYRRRCEWPLRC